MIFVFLSIIIITSCSNHFKTSFTRMQSETKEYNYPQIIFKGQYNSKVKVFVDDSLYFDERIKNENHKVLTKAKTITLDKIPKSIDIKVGIRPKKRILWTSTCIYLIVEKKNYISPLEYKLTIKPNNK